MGELEIRRAPAGSGKSAQIADEIAQMIARQPLGPPVFWIVPPGASYTTERRLLQRVGTTVRAEVLHLDRLAHRVQAAVGGIAQTPVNTTGKRMLLAAAYEQVFEQLTVLRRVSPSISFLDAVLDVFREMAAHLVPPAEIESALETAAAAVAHGAGTPQAAAGRSLLGKLRDICILYVRWQQLLAESGRYDPDTLLARLAPHAGEWSELTGATLYVDGFTTLTPQQIQFLTALAQTAERTVVTLPLCETDCTGEPVEGAPLLATIQDATPVPQAVWTFYALQAEARRLDLQVTVRDGNGGHRYQQAPDLWHLEQNLYHDATAQARLEATNIETVVGQSVADEVEQVAVLVCEWLEQFAGTYRDVLVITPQPDLYLPYLEDTFARFGIPFHADQSTALAAHPLASFLLSLLDAVSQGWSTDSMLRLLRSPFSGISLEEMDWFESYLVQYEVSGDTWFSKTPWRYAESNREDDRRLVRLKSDDDRADRLRRRIAGTLGETGRQLQRTTLTPAAIAHTLWDALAAVGAQEQVADWIVGTDASLDPIQASLHEQAWLKLIDLLNDLAETLPEQPLPAPFLFQLVRAALEGESLVTIPQGVDEVNVVDLEGAVGSEGKWVALMGAADGVLPRRVRQRGILLDEERTVFAALFGTRLGWTTEERQVFERQTPYFALTRASSRLIVSYPLSDDAGKAVRPSLLVSRIQSLFRNGIPERARNGEQQSWSLPPAAWSRLTPQAAWERLIPELGSGPVCMETRRLAAAATAAATQAVPKWLTQSLSGWHHKTQAAPLDRSLATALFGTAMRINVHQLETFAACPFRHFTRFGLRLQEQRSADITAAVRGTLLHDALERFVRMQLELGEAAAAWRDDEAASVMDRIFDELMQTPKMQVWLRRHTRQQQAAAVRDTLRTAAVVLTKHVRHGLFRPKAIEWSFGTGEEAQMDGWELPVGDGVTLTLRGRIDRIDTFQAEDGSKWFRIIDYKSSSLDLDLSKVAHGLQLQLPVYAMVLADAGGTWLGADHQAAGLIYIPLATRVTAAITPPSLEEAEQERFAAMRASGRIIGDGQVVAAMDQRIADGNSDLFRKMYNKDGSFAKTAPVLMPADWDWMQGQVKELVRGLALRIHHGDIEIKPIRYGAEEACTHCEMKALCSIDSRHDTDLFRTLPKFSGDKLQAWHMHAAEQGGTTT